jgi:hypothetical protein
MKRAILRHVVAQYRALEREPERPHGRLLRHGYGAGRRRRDHRLSQSRSDQGGKKLLEAVGRIVGFALIDDLNDMLEAPARNIMTCEKIE